MEKEQSIMNIASKYGEYLVKDGEIIFVWPETVSISKEDLWKEIDGDWEIFESLQYQRDREAEYPTIQECVHAILDDDLTALQEKRQLVKTKYPKS